MLIPEVAPEYSGDSLISFLTLHMLSTFNHFYYSNLLLDSAGSNYLFPPPLIFNFLPAGCHTAVLLWLSALMAVLYLVLEPLVYFQYPVPWFKKKKYISAL